MNIKNLNKTISEIKNLKDIFISGSAGDESLSIGACYYLAQKDKTYPLKDLYLGYKEEKINLKIYQKIKFYQIKNLKPIIKIFIMGK